MAVHLARPAAALLPEYLAALEAGWSVNTTRDTGGEQRAAIAADPDAFLAELNRQEGGGTVTGMDGQPVPRLPGRVFWIWDDGPGNGSGNGSGNGFCGGINLRFQPGTEALPPHVSGHAGYSVVPWKQRRGIATRALALLLPVARGVGLARILLTTDEANDASRRVIEANGGQFAGTEPSPHHGGARKLLFWVGT